MENTSDNKPVTDIQESNNHKPDTDANNATSTEPLYFTKDGKTQFGITAPAAFALSYPYPPLPSNLSKNRVLRAVDEQTKESVQEGITEAEKEYDKEAMPLPSLTLQGSPLPKVLIPEIELALYWDRHPYEFRVPEHGTVTKQNGLKSSRINSPSFMRRSKSEMNLASKVGKLLEESSIAGNSNSRSSRRSSVSASNKTIRSNADTVVSSVVMDERKELLGTKNGHYDEHLAFPSNGNGSNHVSNGNRCTNGKCGSANSISSREHNDVVGAHVGDQSSGNKMVIRDHGKVATGKNGNVTNKPLHMSESERRKFDDIKFFHHQHERQSQGQSGNARPKLIRSQEQLENCVKKSAGVQVTIDDVTTAAMKSTYLCPLHGQYKRGIERRDKGGFRTDMSSINDVHAHCSRALKGKSSKTKMIKTAETQTDGESDVIPFQSLNNRTNKRSKTAGHTSDSRKGREIMASEYHGSFRDPYKIAESEKRHLRNKILNYCFTKHSIF